MIIPYKKELVQTITRFCVSKYNNLFKMSKTPFRVAVEGNIGAGKSTLIDYYKSYPNVDVYPEPISSWCDVKGNNLLDLIYKDLNKWNFSFQHYVQLSRLNLQTSPPSNLETKVQIFERSVQSSRNCFTKNSYKYGYLTDVEYDVLCCWFDWIEKSMNINLDLIVYLRSSPEIVHKRMLQRCRSEEMAVPLEYLKQVHESYEQWLIQTPPENLPSPVLIIDADQSLDDIVKSYKKYESRIFGTEIL
ncbi:thymidine kinase 2, mitochondrial-like [Ctenocephalides felis]|uniref:thymidine kinase 2, mitochondrial-like n=1 Tax=Ctenocephalides felis TaxID=7515 RepID=UPI000E6E340A|nr:thymidine kinase 2, mitochondrial-like [Ctenocephalides felis]